jgi:dienelactone hydrolase
MELQEITYCIGNKSFTGYLADGSKGKTVPGILVAHEGTGMTEHTKERTLMLADLGYIAFAMDIFGETNITPERSKALVQGLRADLPTLRHRANFALDLLKAQPHVDPKKTAAIGFCFGGTAVLELARSGADVACVVGFHSGLATTAPEDATSIKGQVLVCLGANDPIISVEQRNAFVAEMNAAKVRWQMNLYGGVGHSFTNRWVDAMNLLGFAYDRVADRRSWLAMQGLFNEVFESMV